MSIFSELPEYFSGKSFGWKLTDELVELDVQLVDRKSYEWSF